MNIPEYSFFVTCNENIQLENQFQVSFLKFGTGTLH